MRYMQIIAGANNDKDFKPIFQTFGQIAKDMVKRCWWNKNEIDCNKQFVNHVLDFSICFTFNQNSSDLDSTGSVGKKLNAINFWFFFSTVFLFKYLFLEWKAFLLHQGSFLALNTVYNYFWMHNKGNIVVHLFYGQVQGFVCWYMTHMLKRPWTFYQPYL